MTLIKVSSYTEKQPPSLTSSYTNVVIDEWNKCGRYVVKASGAADLVLKLGNIADLLHEGVCLCPAVPHQQHQVLQRGLHLTPGRSWLLMALESITGQDLRCFLFCFISIFISQVDIY